MTELQKQIEVLEAEKEALLHVIWLGTSSEDMSNEFKVVKDLLAEYEEKQS